MLSWDDYEEDDAPATAMPAPEAPEHTVEVPPVPAPAEEPAPSPLKASAATATEDLMAKRASMARLLNLPVPRGRPDLHPRFGIE